MPTITVLPHGFRIDVSPSANLFAEIDRAGRERGLEIFPLGLCGGKLQCCQCGVVVLSGGERGLSTPYPRERDLVRDTGYPHGARLTCISRVRADVTVRIPEPAERRPSPEL
jgi:ferredoxin